MATLQSNAAVGPVTIGGFDITCAAGGTFTVPDDLVDEVIRILEGNRGRVITIISYDGHSLEIDAAVEYGVVADGATDTTTALQASLDALVASNGRAILRLPSGILKITSALTLGLCNSKTIIGAGRDATKIRQFTANTPVLKATAENTYGMTLADLTLEYNTQQTSGQTSAIALNFDKTGGTGSGWYYWRISNVAFRKAQRGIAITGTGQLPIFNFTCYGLWFQDMATSALDWRSPTVIGSMPNTFTNTIITNGGIVPSAQAVVANVASLIFDGFSITNWKGRILYANGGSFVHFTGLHIETCTFEGQFGVLLAIDDTGILTVENASITVEITDGTTDHWVVLAGAGASVHIDGLYLAITNTSGSAALLNASGVGARVFLRDVIDANGTVTVPTVTTDLAARANVVRYEDRTFASLLTSYSGLVSYYRFGEASGTAAKDLKGVQDGVYVGTPTRGVPGLTWGDPNTAVGLNGSSQAITVADNASHHVGGTFSIIAWINLAEIKQQALFGSQANAPFFEITSGNVLRIVRDSVAEIALGTVNPNVGVPQMVAWTRNGSGTDKIYLNGADVTGAVTGTGMNNTNGFSIGNVISTEWFHGTIDEFALFNVQLTAAQMAALFAAGRGY